MIRYQTVGKDLAKFEKSLHPFHASFMLYLLFGNVLELTFGNLKNL